jgi:glycosyltransferase involved in cell wall biosynthesis
VLADITPVILTYNESANIGRSLERLSWAREVIVVDSGSTDDTLAIAAGFPNVRSVHRPFDSHARQWQFATTETGVTTDWILRLDADYMLPPALRDEIATLSPDAGTAAYQIAEAEKLAVRPWSELSWADRLRCTRVLGPLAVAVHCLFVKGLIFDGTAGLFYTAQRITADMILSMHLLRRDLARLSAK